MKMRGFVIFKFIFRSRSCSS